MHKKLLIQTERSRDLINLVSARPAAAATAGEHHNRLNVCLCVRDCVSASVCFVVKTVLPISGQNSKAAFESRCQMERLGRAALPPSAATAAAAAAAAAMGEGLPRTGERCLERLHPPPHG